jgi:hypothetical protein
MAKLECFTIGGIELWFYSNDHLPPHFHAKRKGQWEVRVNFLESTPARMFSVVWAKDKGVPRADTKLIEALVAAHRAELLKEWEEKVQPDEN